MSTSTWGGPESYTDEMYPPTLLIYLLKQMMLHFGAQGACIALHDESIGQMKVQAHIRFKSVKSGSTLPGSTTTGSLSHPHSRQATIKLESDDQFPQPMRSIAQNSPLPSSPSGVNWQRTPLVANDDIEEVAPQQSDLFPVGTTYAIGQDLIGYVWQKNEAYAMRHEDYMMLFRTNHTEQVQLLHTDITPSHYLIVPVRESTVVEELRGRKRPAAVLGVIVLYHISTAAPGFQKQRAEALQYVEQIALYLQNDKLRRTQRRVSEYLQLLQNISTAFPKSVMLSELVDQINQFVERTVDSSSMLLTLYDRDLDRLYDVFAINDGQRMDSLIEQPTVRLKTERPVWWHVTQNQRQTLLFSPTRDQEKAREYGELLTGVWGDQRKAESFLLLPMKMFNRVSGALCLTSKRPHAYHPEEIQVLETMVQIVTVSIENAKLYERDRSILYEARQREGQLAAINSALQAISSVLNVTELLNNLVESAAAVVKVDLCVFFEPSTSNEELKAHALYAPSSVKMVDDGSGLPIVTPPRKGQPDEIINMIQLPFKGTFLEQMTDEGFFYLDPPKLEELALKCNEGGNIFLCEIGIEYMLMIPMSYQTQFIGFLAVPTPPGNRFFKPKDVGTLLAICAQAASAIRNAQLFEQREDAYAELQRMDKLKDEFLVTASHELRTPLTAISGYASQLMRQSSRATPQQIHKFATKISVASQQLKDLVSSMTEAAQIGPIDRKLDLHLEPVELYAAAEIAVNMLTHSSEHIINLNIPRNLWLQGDAPRVRQVLTNLLENATKYSPPDSHIQVTASTMKLAEIEPLLSEDQVDHTMFIEQREETVVLVRVKDQGEGILPDDRQKIFEKFVRATRSLTTPVRGSGLGLYICRRFVEAMGGKLWLEECVANEGSTFSFFLPQVEPPVDAVVS